MARVKLIVSRDDIAAEHHALFDELAALRGRISGPSTVVLHSPGLARPWNEISEYLHRHSVVEAQHAELAVCATAREKDCAYIWNAHVPLARKAGVPAGTIDLLRDRRNVIGMSGAEMAIVQYVRTASVADARGTTGSSSAAMVGLTSKPFRMPASAW